MPAIEPLCRLIISDASMITFEERVILEFELFSRVIDELKEIFKEQYRNYFRIMNFTFEKENLVLESSFVQLIINDIISSGEYSLKGIAYYTDTFEDVVEEMMVGLNQNPSALFLRRLIELHRSVRRDLYHYIMKKIIAAVPTDK